MNDGEAKRKLELMKKILEVPIFSDEEKIKLIEALVAPWG